MSGPNYRRKNDLVDHRHGTTLLEVLLGLIILATLLSSVVMARGRFLRQWSDADRRLELIRAADRLMNDLSHGQPDQLKSAGGTLADPPDARWRTTLIRDANAGQLNAVHFRLSVEDGRTASSVQLDFLVHNPRATTTPVGRP